MRVKVEGKEKETERKKNKVMEERKTLKKQNKTNKLWNIKEIVQI